MKRYVLTNKIKSNPYQPVINFSLENLEKAKELINNKDYLIILKKVDDDYFIVVGEDIFQASEKMEVLELEAIVLEKVDVDIMEYINEKNLSSIEEAILYINIMNDTKLTQVQLAKKINKTQSTIANKIRLLNLQQEVQDGLIANKISERHGRSLLVLEGDQ
ncbi:MAG: ParB/RepB/Spo0J family partition protein, partial [Erysipelotrichaceae bacterium]